MNKILHLPESTRYISLAHVLYIDVEHVDMTAETASVIVYFDVWDALAESPHLLHITGREAFGLIRKLHQL